MYYDVYSDGTLQLVFQNKRLGTFYHRDTAVLKIKLIHEYQKSLILTYINNKRAYSTLGNFGGSQLVFLQHLQKQILCRRLPF